MKKLNELEQSIYDEYLNVKADKLKRVEEIRHRSKVRYIQLLFPSGHDYIWNVLKYDKPLNKFISIEYAVYVNNDVELKTIEL